MGDRETTADLMARLQRHYIKPGEALPGGIFVDEVGFNNGGQGRRCDGIYVGFTTTSGRIMIGHEVKASRADWLHELAQTGKADMWADQCHAWYVVAPSIEIVKPEELPHGWGLMVLGKSKTRMDIKVKATVDRDHVPSWLAMRSVMARYDTLRAGVINRARIKAREDAQAEATKREEDRRSSLAEMNRPMSRDERDRLQALESLEAHLGCTVSFYAYPLEGDTKVSARDFAAALKVTNALKSVSWPVHASKQIQRAAVAVAEADKAVAEYLAVVESS